MDDLVKIFSNSEFGNVRVIVRDGEPWFVGKEVAEILGYGNTRQALKTNVDKEDTNTVHLMDGNKKGNPNKTIINESGLYSLIVSSKLPSAKRFKRWVTSEVLPSIRKHGTYLTPAKIEEVLLNPDTIIKLATELKNERKKNQDLAAANKALVGAENTWDDRAVINALVRSYASACCQNNFAKAWNTYYKRLNYAMRINIRNRKSDEGHDRPLLDMITDDEIPKAVRQIVAMCEEANIDTGSIINRTNLVRVM